MYKGLVSDLYTLVIASSLPAPTLPLRCSSGATTTGVLRYSYARSSTSLETILD